MQPLTENVPSPRSSVGSTEHLRTGCRWFEPPARPLFFPEFDDSPGLIHLAPLSIVSTMVMWKSSLWVGKNIVRSSDTKNFRKTQIGALVAEI